MVVTKVGVLLVSAQRPKPVMAFSAALAANRAAWVEERGVRLDMGNLLGVGERGKVQT